MKPKAKRERLFGKQRPFIRAVDLQQDFWVLWAAYDLESFPKIPKGLNVHEFRTLLMQMLSTKSAVLMVEDRCKWFKEGRGPVGLITVHNFGWRIEPFCEFFRWTTNRMKLRAIVSFLQMVRYDSVGVCLARVPEKFSKFYGRLREYGVMFPCGKIPFGTEEGPEYLFYIHGKKKAEKFDPLVIDPPVMEAA